MLAQLASLREVRDLAEQLIDLTTTIAGTTGAGGQAIGEALNVTRSAVRKKYPNAVSGRTGPRKAAATTYGRADWNDNVKEGAAERDWLIRARVQLRQDASTGGAGVRRVARAGDILEMVMRGHAGAWVDTEVWQTDEPVLDALIVYADTVDVLEILEETSPWHERGLAITAIMAPHAGGIA
ncbi:hypothetical protein AB0L88_09315 [Saccharopolyspora shandongensis]|uniref:hypothetical protein n=1 Tax=Saccharopolyspora shandongensis TaxID=418495 RepID=UPI003427E894